MARALRGPRPRRTGGRKGGRGRTARRAERRPERYLARRPAHQRPWPAAAVCAAGRIAARRRVRDPYRGDGRCPDPPQSSRLLQRARLVRVSAHQGRTERAPGRGDRRGGRGRSRARNVARRAHAVRRERRVVRDGRPCARRRAARVRLAAAAGRRARCVGHALRGAAGRPCAARETRRAVQILHRAHMDRRSGRRLFFVARRATHRACRRPCRRGTRDARADEPRFRAAPGARRAGLVRCECRARVLRRSGRVSQRPPLARCRRRRAVLECASQSRPGSRGLAAFGRAGARKVRTPQGGVMANGHPWRHAEQGNRKQTADGPAQAGIR
ncbi:hypothetical protein BCEP27_11783 [Burkholderia cepacia]